MDPLCPALQNKDIIVVKPILTPAIFAGVGSFSLEHLLLLLEEERKKKVGSNSYHYDQLKIYFDIYFDEIFNHVIIITGLDLKV